MMSKKNISKKFLEKNILKCVFCNSSLQLKDESLICENNHNYDIKKNGSCFLLKNSNYKDSKFYTKTLFENRRNFILNGYYEEINTIIKNFIINNKQTGNILDIGCGEGTHTHLITKELEEDFKIYGIDYSKDAIDLATSYITEKKMFFVGDVNNIPIIDNSIDIVIDYLSPFNTESINRILKNDGLFIKIIPTANYLKELRKINNLEQYNEQETKIDSSYKVIYDKIIEKTFEVQNINDKKYLASMTPLTWNVKTENYSEIKEITISLRILILRKQ